MITIPRAVFRYLGVITIIATYLVVQSFVFLLFRDKMRERIVIANSRRATYLALKVLGITLSSPPPEVQGELIVCNHLSYVDVLFIYAFTPGRFITSVEIRETFLLGQITLLSGCFFVERRAKLRDKARLLEEMRQMQQTLNYGHNVILFPEGTSSNGDTVLAFKPTLFQIAIDNQTRIRPLVLKYHYAPHERDSVCWYGDMTFPDHLWALCKLKSVRVTFKALEAIEPTGERAELAKLAETRIREAYHAS